MRSAVVTGASTGIGRATALLLEAEGWPVFAGVRREEDGETLRNAGRGSIEPLVLRRDRLSDRFIAFAIRG